MNGSECLAGPRIDNVFGPQIQGCRNDFDFTLLFEQSILWVIPSVAFILAWPLKSRQLLREKVKIIRVRSLTHLFSLALIIAFIATQTALIVLWGKSAVTRTQVSIPAATLSTIAGGGLLVLSRLEHTRSIRPSTIINSYLLLTVLLDIPQARTLWLRDHGSAISWVYTIGTVLKAAILCLEARQKKRVLAAIYRRLPPEALAGIINRVLFWWLNALFTQGFRQMLSLGSLHPIEPGLSSRELAPRFQRFWVRQNKSGRYPLLFALLSCFKSEIIIMVILRSLQIGFTFSQPLLINSLVNVLDHSPDAESKQKGMALIGATALIYLGLATTNSLFKHQLNRISTKIRGALIGSIYFTTLAAKLAQKDDSVITHVSTDIQRICFIIPDLHNLVAGPIEVAIAIYLLQRQVGWISIAPILVCLAATASGFWMAKSSGIRQSRWLDAVQKRLNLTSAVLGIPKSVKMLGLTEIISDKIQESRNFELEESKPYRRQVVLRNLISFGPKMFSPVVVFIAFIAIRGKDSLTPANTFTTLSLVYLLCAPTMELVSVIPMSAGTLSFLVRIQNYLLKDTTLIQTINGENASDSFEMATFSPLSAPGSGFPSSVASITISNGSFGYADGTPVLKDINMTTPLKKLTMVMGPVGSGKSTMLKALLGELPIFEGEIQIPRNQVAYCSQDPWLPNDSIRNIIVGPIPFDENWYNTVIKACSLEQDLSQFPAGDSTLSGSKGISLSGGQQHRISLARAIYSRKNILILDDILRGLDGTMSTHVANTCFGPSGLCRLHNMTVVLVTNTSLHLHLADHIISVRNGGIEYQGPPKCTEVSRPVPEFSNEEIPSNGEPPKSTTSIEQTPGNKKVEDLTRRTGDSAVYRYYFRSIGWRRGMVYLISAIIFVTTQKLAELWLKYWSTYAFGRSLGLYMSIYAILNVLSFVSGYLNMWYWLIKIVPKSSSSIHLRLLRSVMNAPYRFFVEVDAGITLNRFSQDIQVIDNNLAGAAIMTTVSALMAIGEGVLILSSSKYAAISVPFILIVLYILQNFYLKTSRQVRLLEIESQAPLQTHLMETVHGVSTIRAFAWQDQFRMRNDDLVDASQNAFYLLTCVQRWLNVVLDLITAGMAVTVVALAVTIRSSSSGSGIGVALVNLLGFNVSLSMVIENWSMLEISLGAIARIRAFERTSMKEDQPGEAHQPPAEWPSSGNISIKGLSAAYRPEGDCVLDSLNIEICSGDKIGICGRSGSGKSSLLLAIFRMLEIPTGKIHLDGIDTSTIPRSSLRSAITTVPQDPPLLPGTIRFNLDPSASASDSILIAALKNVGLWDQITTNYNGSIESDFGSGVQLSQGQRQLFSLARAQVHHILRKSKVLVVDEISSGVDIETEKFMMEIIQRDFTNCTVLAVAHRLDSITGFDKVLVLDQGKIMEFGDMQELKSKRGGWFWKSLQKSSGDRE